MFKSISKRATSHEKACMLFHTFSFCRDSKSQLMPERIEELRTANDPRSARFCFSLKGKLLPETECPFSTLLNVLSFFEQDLKPSRFLRISPRCSIRHLGCFPLKGIYLQAIASETFRKGPKCRQEKSWEPTFSLRYVLNKWEQRCPRCQRSLLEHVVTSNPPLSRLLEA